MIGVTAVDTAAPHARRLVFSGLAGRSIHLPDESHPDIVHVGAAQIQKQSEVPNQTQLPMSEATGSTRRVLRACRISAWAVALAIRLALGKLPFDGDWDNDRMFGRGVMVWADGRRYQGRWRNDQPNGFGTMMWTDGSAFVGQFSKGKANGKGKCKMADGQQSRCKYKSGVLVE